MNTAENTPLLSQFLTAIDLIIPSFSEDDLEDSKLRVIDAFNEKESIFEDHGEFEDEELAKLPRYQYMCGFGHSVREHLTPDTEDLTSYVFFDVLTETGYLQFERKSQGKDDFWTALSLLLNINDLNHLRGQMDRQIYENKDVDFTVGTANKIFTDEHGIVVYGITLNGEMGFGLCVPEKFEELKQILSESILEVRILE